MKKTVIWTLITASVAVGVFAEPVKSSFYETIDEPAKEWS
jgi:hypothetical protein